MTSLIRKVSNKNHKSIIQHQQKLINLFISPWLLTDDFLFLIGFLYLKTYKEFNTGKDMVNDSYGVLFVILLPIFY